MVVVSKATVELIEEENDKEEAEEEDVGLGSST